MTLRFDEPLWLILGLVGLGLGVAAWPWLIGLSRGRRFSAVVARTVLFTVLAMTLGGASDVRRTDDLAVIAVVDVSGSATRFGDVEGGTLTGRVRGALSRAAGGRGPDDLLGIVAFDSRATPVASATRSDPTDRAIEATSGDGSAIADALGLAASMAPRGAAARILLISDGNETAGDALTAAKRLASRSLDGSGSGVRIDVAPIAYRVGAETIVESVDAPPRARSGSRVMIRTVLNSTEGTSGVLRLYRSGEPIDAIGDPPGQGRRVRLGAGKTPVLMDVVLPDARLHRFEAVFSPDVVGGRPAGDRFADNNRAEAFTVSPGQGSVLLVDGVSDGNPDGPGATLARVLRAGGADVRVVAPSGTPGDLIGLQPYDLVVLQDVASDELPPGASGAIASHVRELGGGLIMVGGPSSFGAGAWKGTEVEPILPVKLDLPERLVVPETAIVLVLDSSGSMSSRVGGSMKSQQEIANQAAIAAVETLDARDLVGVVDFESDARWVAELGPNTRPEATAAAIGNITAGGGTNMPPAITLAGEALRRCDAKVKHIVVLTDGVSSGSEQLPVMAAELAADGITISTIGIGDGSDVTTLRRVAEAGGGSFYPVVNPTVLPRVFVKAVRIVRSPMIRETPFEPVVLDGSSPAWTGIGATPELNGLVLTRFRDDPRAARVLATPEGEPVLAHWTVELGRVAAFTSDAWKWSEPWLGWPGYQQLWNQLAGYIARSSEGGRSVFRAVSRGDGLELTYTAVDDRGAPVDLLTMPVTVYRPDGQAESTVLEQVGPGVYRGSLEARETGTYVAVATPKLGATRLAPSITGVSVASGVEYDRLSSNTALLEQIAAATGGRVLSLESLDGETLWDRTGIEPRIATASLWQNLVVIALVVLVLDIGTRKVAWDRAASVGSKALVDAEKRAVATLRRLRERGAAASEPAVESAPARPRERTPKRVRPEQASRPREEEVRLVDKTQRADEPGPSGLLAAKRRAAKRFEED